MESPPLATAPADEGVPGPWPPSSDRVRDNMAWWWLLLLELESAEVVRFKTGVPSLPLSPASGWLAVGVPVLPPASPVDSLEPFSLFFLDEDLRTSLCLSLSDRRRRRRASGWPLVGVLVIICWPEILKKRVWKNFLKIQSWQFQIGWNSIKAPNLKLEQKM